ncbi:MAG: hypothetical protein DMG24_22195 [Acidobacteria bacterium]|nr:MAG: hypothetical protein DMG24_22195 [Acidobacteriota bacterium]
MKRMRIATLLILTVTFFTCRALPQVQSLGAKDTMLAAKLSTKEMQEIVAALNPRHMTLQIPGAKNYARRGSILAEAPVLCSKVQSCSAGEPETARYLFSER